MIAEIKSIINTLFNDKLSMKKREDELARIRSMQNRAISGNFEKMKGKLPWPVQGKIISHSPQFEKHVLNSNVALFAGATPYSKHGNMPLLIFFMIFIFMHILKRKLF